MTSIERAPRPGRRAGPLFGWAVGILVGVAITGLLVPKARYVTASDVPGSFGGGIAGSGAPVAGDGLPGEGAAAGAPAAGATGGAGAGAGAAGASGGEGGAGAPSNAVGSPGGSGSSAASGAAVRGVTANTIKIGVAVPDLGAVAALGPGYDDGDPQKHMESILAAWKRDRVLPVNGRQIEFVYRSFNILSDADARAACTGLVKDEKVFMVIAVHSFGGTGGDCVTSELHTPLVTTDQISEDEAARTAPWYFTLQTSQTRMQRNWVHWADQRGLLRDKRIGLYYFASEAGQVLPNMRDELVHLGYGKQIVAEVTSDSEGGGPSDAVAVQRFRAAQVDLAWLVVDQLSQSNFMNVAEAQGYHPTYVESDYRFSTTDTATMTYPTAQFDGTYGMTFMHYGEGPAGIPLSPELAKCVQDYAAYSGRTVDRQQRDAEFVSLNQACDEARVVLAALQRAGPALTPERFVAALETLHEFPMGIHASVTFGPGKHDGADTQRTMQWQGSCRCWKALGTFEPYFVP